MSAPIALFQDKTASGKIRCGLCPHRCVMDEGGRGRCRIRGVLDGELHALGYGLISSLNVDPMEKKPLYHFLPGSKILSVGGWGCNLSCRFCQNWTISQNFNDSAPECGPDRIIKEALQACSAGIAYTYNEPLINIEYVRDCAEKAKERGMVNVLVTNGFLEREPASSLLPLIDALNIDIKSMDDAFYRRECGGKLEPVLKFARQALDAGSHIEITNLLIPGLNDSPELVGSLSGWISVNLGRGTPLHLSAYRPEYKMDLPPTSDGVLESAYERCANDLDYVYIGNSFMRCGRDTRCPSCGHVLISRQGYSVNISGLTGHACSNCGREADCFLPDVDETKGKS